MTNYILHAESGEFRIQGGEVKFTVESISEAVELESRIPPDAKMAVKDFIEQTFKEALDAVNDIIINIPKELEPYAEALVDIIKLFIDG